MAIKVRHEGNLTSRIVAGAGSGAAKRAIESAALIRPRQVQLTHAATAQAHAPSGGHAQLIHAPLGGGGGSAPLIHAPAPTGGVRGGLGGAGGGDGNDYKVTGTSIFSRPDEESQWDPGNGGRWIRKWLPGEKEAEAKRRVGEAENDVLANRFDYRLSAEQKNEIAKINSALEDARKSGRFSPDEMKELERQANERRLGIKPLPVPHEDTAQESFDKRIVEANGVKGWLNSKGDFQPFEGGASAADVYGGTHVDESGRRWGVDKSGKLYEVGGGRDDSAELMKMAPTNKEVEALDPVTGKQLLDPVTGKPKMRIVDLTPEERIAKMEELRTIRDGFNRSGRSAGMAGTDGGFGYEQFMRMMDPMFAYKQQPLIQQIVAEQQAAQTPGAVPPSTATPAAPAAAPAPAAPQENPNDPMAKWQKYKRNK